MDLWYGSSHRLGLETGIGALSTCFVVQDTLIVISSVTRLHHEFHFYATDSSGSYWLVVDQLS